MNKVLKFIAFNIIRFILWTRYHVEYTGRELLTPENLSKKGGILFLPNHTAEVDPLIVGIKLWKEFEFRPLIVEWIIKLPVIGGVMRLMRGVPIPDFEQKGSLNKAKNAEEAFNTIIEGLKLKDNFLLYPSGRLRYADKEIIGGASGLHKIITANPDVNIVLVRTRGLWGSIFSKGWNGENVHFGKSVIKGFLTVIKNGLFFVPKRKVFVEYVPMNNSFPWSASRKELNLFLEKWYNLKPDPLNLVPYQFWNKKVENHNHPYYFRSDIDDVPLEIQKKVTEEIAKISKCVYTEIKPQMHLFSDLRLDSLSIQEILMFLEEEYDVQRVNPDQLTTVASVMNFAAHSESPQEKNIELLASSANWKSLNQGQPINGVILGNSLPESFFSIACERRHSLACADLISHELSYEKMMVGVMVLAKKIRQFSGEYIGILLPASVAVNILILAVQVAGKIPVMMNWTVGKNHIQSVIETTRLKYIISSKKFLDNIKEVELGDVSKQLIYMEDLKANISLYDKIKALCLSKMSCSFILKKLGLNHFDKTKTAVLLFTSGTEAQPKGVPLSHENIMVDLQAALDRVEIMNKDVILGFLPPFHSYGFTVGGLLPLIAGIRVMYYPNPTHYKKLARLIGKWHVTVLAGAPTFLKGILQPQLQDEFKTLRIIISGAEKASEALLERIKKLCPQVDFLEGYGLSECAPILTLNDPKKPHCGVGLPLSGVEVIIVDPETLTKQPCGQQGLILAKGPNIFKGYFGKEVKQPFVEVEGEQWFKTGDLGVLNENNFLTIVGRLKRQIKIGGEMVNLNAIEEGLNHFLSHEKNMDLEKSDAPVIAVCAQETQDRPHIYLFTTLDITLEEVNQQIKKLGFSNLSRINFISKVDLLPVMVSGKIHYRKLEETLNQK